MNNSPNHMSGDVAEIVVFTRVLSQVSFFFCLFLCWVCVMHVTVRACGCRGVLDEPLGTAAGGFELRLLVEFNGDGSRAAVVVSGCRFKRDENK